MCQKLQMDKKDMIAFFHKIKNSELITNDFMIQLEDVYDINKLEVERIIRYIDTLYTDTESDVSPEINIITLKNNNIDTDKLHNRETKIDYRILSSSSIE